jgi:hypothetical protein
VGGTQRCGFELPSAAGEPAAERRGLVRIVLAELIDEGAGEDRAVAAVRAFNGAAFDVGLAARAVLVLADRPGWELEQSLRVAAWLEHGEDHSDAAPREPK